MPTRYYWKQFLDLLNDTICLIAGEPSLLLLRPAIAQKQDLRWNDLNMMAERLGFKSEAICISGIIDGYRLVVKHPNRFDGVVIRQGFGDERMRGRAGQDVDDPKAKAGQVIEYLTAWAELADAEVHGNPTLPMGEARHGGEVSGVSIRSEMIDASPGSGGGVKASSEADKAGAGNSPHASVKPSHRRAKGLYEWAIEHIKGAEEMTYAQIFDALCSDARCGGEGLPPNAETFARYCRAAGIQRNTPGQGIATPSVRRESQI